MKHLCALEKHMLATSRWGKQNKQATKLTITNQSGVSVIVEHIQVV